MRSRDRNQGWIRETRRRSGFCLLLLASLPVSAADWQTTTQSESRIVFSGPEVAGTRAFYRHLSFKANNYRAQTYSTVWRSKFRPLPVLFMQLNETAPDRHFPDYLQADLIDFARSHLFKDKDLSFGKAGSATTAPGKAEYLVFTVDEHECSIFRQFDMTGAPDDLGTHGRIRLWGFHCPKPGIVKAGDMKSLLARVGVRSIAVPEMAAQQGVSGDSLIQALDTGNIEVFREIFAGNPDASIQFSHPDFAGGRITSGPVLMATTLFGRTEMTRQPLNKGASVDGRARRAICMTIEMRHREVVEILVQHDLKVNGYTQCGRGRNLLPLELAERLNLTGITKILRKTGG